MWAAILFRLCYKILHYDIHVTQLINSLSCIVPYSLFNSKAGPALS
jgi:hypothetical protein